MKNISLTETLKRFDEEFKGELNTEHEYYSGNLRRAKAFMSRSIKDALEAVRVDKGEHICEGGEPPEGEICGERFYTDTWNANTTQYDENVRKYLGEEKV